MLNYHVWLGLKSTTFHQTKFIPNDFRIRLVTESEKLLVHDSGVRLTVNYDQIDDIINIIYIIYEFKYIIKNIKNILFFMFNMSNYIIEINIKIFNFIK